jgi:hypothetical protein
MVIGAAAPAAPLLPAAPASADCGWRLAIRGCWAGGCVPLDDIARVYPYSPGAGAVRNTLRGAGNDAATRARALLEAHCARNHAPPLDCHR